MNANPVATAAFIYLQGPDVGELQRIMIRSSNSGLGASWHLHHVDVYSSSSSEMFHFPFDNWWVPQCDLIDMLSLCHPLRMSIDHRLANCCKNNTTADCPVRLCRVDSKNGLEHYIWRDGTEDLNANALVQYRVTVYTSDIR